jgi:general nucleoside transport system permease protein
MSANTLPRWADLALLPALNLCIALGAAAVVVALVGQSPSEVLAVLVHGAFGTPRGFSYTLYYATTFIFTGLAVAVAFHAGLFNIGGEGQAILGGLGTGLMAMGLSHSLPAWLLLPLMLLAGAGFGMLWSAVPAYLQAYRGSHIVITTIMFNFLASALLAYLLVNHLKVPGLMALESEPFGPAAHLPGMHEALAWLGVAWPASPLNLSLLLALAAATGVQALLWHTRAGYALRAVGSSPGAAAYAGMHPKRLVLLAMAVSGGLAGLVGMNEIAGVADKLLLEFVAGAGFTGIAVALMGRNHPVGIVLASLLFGALFQGGAEVAFEVRGFSREMVVTLQGFIVLFSGAMAYVAAPGLAWTIAKLRRREDLAATAPATTTTGSGSGSGTGAGAAHG